MTLFIILLVVVSFHETVSTIIYSSCTDERPDCDQACTQLQVTREICTPINREAETCGRDDRCGNYAICYKYWCGCNCVHQACTLSEIEGGNVNLCEITKLSNVDHEIGEQIAFQTAGAILGSISTTIGGVPIGTLFSVAWAAWDPVSPITSHFALVDTVIDAVNEAVTQLKGCMDAKISNARLIQNQANVEGLLRQYQLTKQSEGEAKIIYMISLTSDFVREISTIFGSEAGNYQEYEGMLPLFMSLYPLYNVATTETMMYFLGMQQMGNFRPQLKAAKDILDTFYQWIIWARNSIRTSIQARLAALSCTNTVDLLNLWQYNFDTKYVENFGEKRSAVLFLGAVDDINLDEQCNWQCYLNNYDDLKNFYGDDAAGARAHYIQYTGGFEEIRNCQCGEPTPGVRGVPTIPGILGGDGFIQFKTWRIGDFDGNHFSISSNYKKTAKLFRYDGISFDGPLEDDVWHLWDKPLLTEIKNVFADDKNIRFGQWCLGITRLGFLSISHKTGKTAMIWDTSGVRHAGPREDFNCWTSKYSQFIKPLKDEYGAPYGIQFNDEFRIGELSGHFSIVGKKTAVVYDPNGKVYPGPISDWNLNWIATSPM